MAVVMHLQLDCEVPSQILADHELTLSVCKKNTVEPVLSGHPQGMAR